jgi:hypothetical protein
MLYDFILFGGKVRGNGLKLERPKCKLYHNKAFNSREYFEPALNAAIKRLFRIYPEHN